MVLVPFFRRNRMAVQRPKNQRQTRLKQKSNGAPQGCVFEVVQEPARAALSTRQLLFGRGPSRRPTDIPTETPRAAPSCRSPLLRGFEQLSGSAELALISQELMIAPLAQR